MEKNIRDLFENEMFFQDPRKELKYFNNRMETISKYSEDFFKQRALINLVDRYVRALASLTDSYESKNLADVYIDCLMRLGMDDYCIEQEVEDYKATHSNIEENIIVSKSRRKIG